MAFIQNDVCLRGGQTDLPMSNLVGIDCYANTLCIVTSVEKLGGILKSPYPFWVRFGQLNFYQKFPSFLEVKSDINRVNLTLGGTKDEHFSCLHI